MAARLFGLREASAKSARTEEVALRWRGYLTDVGEDEPEEVAVDCPECAKAGVRGSMMVDLGEFDN